ncbi:TPA: winged helix-turn-helix domain-containing protein [Aeromonas dhakensis]|nr:winged helix-turn-helix domain-containing protein [Aeromonas dhakensis]
MIVSCRDLNKRIDLNKNIITSLDRGVYLSKIGHMESKLISFLFDNPSIIITKDEILKSVWSPRVVSSHSVVVGISKVRKILSNPAKKNDFLVSISGVGYIFLAENCPFTVELESSFTI